MKFCTAAEMRRLDEKTITECGIPGVVLMENAGRGAAHLTARYQGPLEGRSIAVICGRGNNGGDGFVMGRIFHGWGARVCFFLLGARENVRGDARINLEAALNMDLPLVEIREEGQFERMDLSRVDLIVDALLGTGLNSEVRGLYREAIVRINAAEAPVVAVDVPSGVDSDNGRVWGAAVQADLTATFGLPKVGLLLPPGEKMAGRLEVVDIGIPPHVLRQADPQKEIIDQGSLSGLLRARDRDGHKGRYGHVLVVAGSTGKTGAAAMAAQAAVRSGAGLVTLAGPKSLNAILEVKVTEAMTEPLPEDPAGFLSEKALDRILELAQGKTVLALGPGLGTTPGAKALVRRLVQTAELPLVIDADGLNILADFPEVWQDVTTDVLLTPHPGEMARLCRKTTAEIAQDRLGAAQALARNFGVRVVLKGYRTVVATPDGRLFLNTTGGPHMASGGMGDILTGVISGLCGQVPNLLDAARLGVFAHGLAADLAARELGPMGLCASDLLPRLPGIWAGLQ